MKKRKGYFITFEGIEGSGKSTQCVLLRDFLVGRGYRVTLTREPGGTTLGTQIRSLLLDRQSRMSMRSEMLLYMASRAELAQQVIQPALKRNEIVISDRWVDATVAYQGYGSGLSYRWIEKIAQFATDSLKPNITFFLDTHVTTGLKRAQKRGQLDRIESRSPAYHRRVCQGYRHLVRRYRRMRLIPEASIAVTHAKIREVIQRVL